MLSHSHIDQEAAKKIFKKLLGAKKTSIATKQNIEQNLLILREEYAKQEGVLKDGIPDVSKVQKGIFTKALNYVMKIVQQDKLTEQFDNYEMYKEKLASGEINKAECDRYVRNIELKKEASTIEKDILDEAKDELGEEYLPALKELVNIKLESYEQRLKDEFNKENGIESKTDPPKKGAEFETLKELAEILDIELNI